VTTPAQPAHDDVLHRHEPEEYSQSHIAPAEGENVRTVFTALAFAILLNLAGCSGMSTVTRNSPCAVETSIECQMERTAHVPQ